MKVALQNPSINYINNNATKSHPDIQNIIRPIPNIE